MLKQKTKKIFYSPDRKKIFSGERKPKTLKTQNQVNIDTKKGRNRNVIKNENDDLEVEPLPKKQKDYWNTENWFGMCKL